MNNAPAKPVSTKNENPWISLLVNIAIPAVILMKLSSEAYLGPLLGLLAALAFPLTYGIQDAVRRRRFNFISALGVVSTLLTGGISLMELDPKWLAVKEAAVPAVIGLAVVLSTRTRYPIVRSLLYNDLVIDIKAVDAALDQHGNHDSFERSLNKASWLLASSFFLSAILNFVLARMIVRSPAGSVAFNEELGRMTALSYPVIALPSMAVMMIALWYLLNRIRGLTHLDLEQIFHPQPR
ncbi:MAG: VC0807 family protein [Gammaproteobacteria bacterium]